MMQSNFFNEIMRAADSPTWTVFAAAFLILFIAIKLVGRIFYSKSKPKLQFDEELDKMAQENAAKSGKKKRIKKQRSAEKLSSTQNVIEAMSTRGAKDSIAGLAFIEPKQVKKSDKKKGKSRRKKLLADEINLNSIENQEPVSEEEGEWQTVSTKERRLVTKREKKQRQDLAEILPLSTTVVAPAKPSPPPSYPPIPNCAKDVAPRFARAAGEEWNKPPPTTANGGKRHVTTASPNKMTAVEPVRPAAVVDPPKPVKWMPTPPAEPVLATGGLWEGSVGPKVMGTGSSGFSPPASAAAWSPLVVTSPSVPAPAAVESQSWVDVGLHGAWPSKQVTALPSAASWDSSAPVTGTDSATHWTGGKDGEEWVHVPSPTTDAAGDRPTWCPPAPVYAQQRQWSDIRTPAPSEPTRAIRREEFVLEPEGYTVSADPWNLDVYDRDGAGDWSPPDAGWANKALDGWTAPAAVAKPQKTYFNESSDDSNPISSAAPSTGGGGGGSNGAAMQPTIVGAGPELLGAGAGKKSRRRRKKKATVNESETFSDVITSAPPAAVKNQVVDGDVIAPDAAAGDVIAPDAAAGDVILQPEVAAAPSEAADPEWGFQKAGKKKRSRVRKED